MRTGHIPLGVRAHGREFALLDSPLNGNPVAALAYGAEAAAQLIDHFAGLATASAMPPEKMKLFIAAQRHQWEKLVKTAAIPKEIAVPRHSTKETHHEF